MPDSSRPDFKTIAEELKTAPAAPADHSTAKDFVGITAATAALLAAAVAAARQIGQPPAALMIASGLFLGTVVGVLKARKEAGGFRALWRELDVPMAARFLHTTMAHSVVGTAFGLAGAELCSKIAAAGPFLTACLGGVTGLFTGPLGLPCDPKKKRLAGAVAVAVLGGLLSFGLGKGFVSLKGDDVTYGRFAQWMYENWTRHDIPPSPPQQPPQPAIAAHGTAASGGKPEIVRADPNKELVTIMCKQGDEGRRITIKIEGMPPQSFQLRCDGAGSNKAPLEVLVPNGRAKGAFVIQTDGRMQSLKF